ncbi:SAC3 family protein B-like [Hibiscus syriacus]|uniref:SAC3 family protein B-like n=1 Tax=Hibiscus syriacus TaxID=106335 RepID=UPI0019216A43|nr:SAC3 family protein B-like [Hibiscus syriacus]XP_039067871.1 SAC3 family protein B-like [Hibiscus syriacus]
MSGFGKHSGPTSAPKSANPFQFQRPPPPSTAPPIRPARVNEAVDRVRSPSSTLEYSGPSVRPYQYGGVQRPVESYPRWDDGKISLKDYDAQIRPRPVVTASFTAPQNSETNFTAKVRFQEPKTPPRVSSDDTIPRNSTQTILQRPSFRPQMPHNPVILPATYPDFPTRQDRSVVSPHLGSPDYRFDDKFSQEHPMFFHNGSKRPMGSPPRLGTKTTSPSSNVPARPRSLPSAGNDPYLAVPPVSNRTRSTLIYGDEFLQDNSTPIEVQNIAPSVSKRTRSPPIYDDEFLQDNSTPTEVQNIGPSVSKRTRSPPLIYDDEFLQDNSTPTEVRNIGLSVSKRTRSPSIYRDEVLQDNSAPIEDDTERELQAKAKRLARFKTELSEPDRMNPPHFANQRLSTTRFQHNVEEKNKHVGEQSMDSSREFLNDTVLSDFDGTEASRVIVGLCPDMCPESERAERERKGDLDQYERLDGDRNQTSEYLAVKKYTRTAEREASLIRPMPVLQKTIDYLLDLLDQPYDDRFLGIYNFLWDRMRAIRMDLRMQHIFDKGAITMLEQMIRLHIIAMHELCEYTKGEGFSEGFDAHLNIEQMNKTSVELFQMYDDHRKKGINVPTEKEFRGYYALLKLDKHPGYKVEPAELSLDLAKMTPEIRQTPEVLFARNVARACRTGNFVAFFRLARKASYLQACLMHAHFAKLRTQAFASLHSSLQNNQGLPVTHVAKWLGIEEEDIESILDYYGFSIREFEEPYMVKDGSFLNAENDYPTRRSRLVLRRRSRTIAGDVVAPHEVTPLPIVTSKESQLGKAYTQRAKATPPKRKSSVLAVDEEMSDSKVVPSPKSSLQLHSATKTSKGLQQLQEGHIHSGSYKPFNFSLDRSSPRSPPAKVGVMEKANNDTLFTISGDGTNVSGMKQVPLFFSQASQPERLPSGRFDLPAENSVPRSMADNVKSLPVRSPSGKFTDNSIPQTMAITDLKSQSERPSVKYNYALGNSEPQGMAVDGLGDKPRDSHQELENQKIVANIQHKEVAEAKLKLILRLWSRRAAKQRLLREQRQLAAEAALSSLPLGIPLRQNNNQWNTFGELDFDHVMRERYEKYESSWSRLNVSDVVSGILGQRNPDAKCLCWKIILCSPESKQGDQLGQKNQVGQLAAGPWLFSKIMPSSEDGNGDDLAITSTGVSIWKKWVPSLSGTDLTCCLSVVKDASCVNLYEATSGASAVLFVVSYNIPWELQKAQLHNLLNLVPPGSCLPLLVLSGSYNVEDSDPFSVIVNELGLHNIDKSRVCGFSVVFLVGKQYSESSNGFLSDKKLREGLKWLANESPLQPVINGVKTGDFVMSHLSPVLEELDKMSDYEVGPNHCISVFNEALDWSSQELASAIKANPTNWPCPEIMSLKDFSDELLAVKLFLPSVGWSSTEKTAPLECALKDCQLPRFPDVISLLQSGSKMGKDIHNHVSLLENCLTEYLTQSTKMMGIQLATKETSVMLQRNTRLELRNLSYYLVPNWITIFRRIFNWRLLSLSTEACSFSYVLQTHHVPPMSGDSIKLRLEVETSPHCLSHPSLDEILEVGYSPLKSRRISFDPEPSRAETTFHTVVQEAATTSISQKSLDEDNDSSKKHGLAIVDTSKANDINGKTTVAVTKTDRLSQLLEKCNIVQNSISEKLSIYF